MSVFSSNTAFTGACSNPNQSPINLSSSVAKPCDLMCELVIDDAYIPQANVMISDEGLIVQSDSGLGSCKFNGEGYTCKHLLLNHPSHHTIENIQADAEVIAVFTNPSGKYLFVSSLVRVNPRQSDSTHFFNAFIPYANSSVSSTSVSLGEQWGLFMMAPPEGAYFVYDGSFVTPPCVTGKWVVFRSMINIDPNDFALLVKNVAPGSRPVQALGDREVFFNDAEHVAGVPNPKDGKVYIRFKRAGKKKDTKPVEQVPLKDKSSKEKTDKMRDWISKELNMNSIMGWIDVIIMIVAAYFGITWGWQTRTTSYGFSIIMFAQNLAAWIRNLFMKAPPPEAIPA